MATPPQIEEGFAFARYAFGGSLPERRVFTVSRIAIRVTLPPACSIAARAEAETLCAVMLSA